jgi:predicted MPP superfamily phosphohydrolase
VTVKQDLPLRDLSQLFVEKRVVKISDLHYRRPVSEEYQRCCIRRINLIRADLIVIIGDYVTLDGRGGKKKQI